MRLIRGIVGLCVVLLLSTSTTHAVLIKDAGLILDTTTGLRWVPVSQFSGALAIEDLDPGQRYVTSLEVNTLLGTYVTSPLLGSCDFFGGPFCSPAVYQAAVDFIDIFQAEISSPPHTLRGVYDPTGPKDSSLAMFLTLYATDEGGVFLDRQGTNFPLPPPVEGFGMLLVSTVPEPSTLVLWCGGIVLLYVLRTRGKMPVPRKQRNARNS
jgi:hypothetical protein